MTGSGRALKTKARRMSCDDGKRIRMADDDNDCANYDTNDGGSKDLIFNAKRRCLYVACVYTRIYGSRDKREREKMERELIFVSPHICAYKYEKVSKEEC